MRKKLRLPSPAMIVALLSLCVALGGSAYAAGKINGKNIKNGTISGKKLKNRTITARKLNTSTLQSLARQKGPRGPRGRRGGRGAKGTKGDKGADGSAVAYARVASDGTIDTSRSKNIAQANMSHPVAGIYCFVSLGFTPKNVVTTLEPTSAGDEVIYASIPDPSPGLGCAAGAVTVQTRHTAGAPDNAAFYVVFN